MDSTDVGAFLVCIIITVVAIATVRSCAESLGGAISARRTEANGVPADCADPLNRSAIAMKKWKDQAWQLFVHCTMGAAEVYLLTREKGAGVGGSKPTSTWWDDPATTFNPCPDTQEHIWQMKFFYLLQLAIWGWTGFSCKWLESDERTTLR